MGYKAAVVGGTLHLRSGMSEQAMILADIPTNTSIYVKDVHNPTWIRAVYDNHLGFVMREYLHEYPAQPAFGVEGCQHYGQLPLAENSEYIDSVITLQCDLWEYKYRDLTVDGDFGMDTKIKVMDYQGIHSLTKDGIVGTETKNCLFADWLAQEPRG